MKINITKEGSLQSIVASAVRDVTDVDLGTFTSDAVEEIQRRTQSGRDPDNNNFKAYSKSYAEYKKSIGRTGKPDLTLTGNMLSGLTYKITHRPTETTAEIFIINTNSIAPKDPRESGTINEPLSALDKARQVSKKRPFMALSQKQIDKLLNLFRGK